MKKAFGFFLILAMMLASCARAPLKEKVESVVPVEAVQEELLVEKSGPRAMAPAPGGAPGLDTGLAAYSEIPDRMIIRRISMQIIVEDTDAILAQIHKALAEYGGYVADSRRWLVDDQAYATVTVRVPAEHLDAFLEGVRQRAIRVENETSSGEDVTEEYVDINARLRNLEATEQELLELLTEVRKNRGKAEEILAIHARITEIRGEIESLKGRAQYLERMSALATITIDIRPRQQPGTIVEPARWNPLVTLANAAKAFIEVLRVLVDVAIWLLVFSPFVLIPLLIVWLVVRAVRRRRKS